MFDAVNIPNGGNFIDRRLKFERDALPHLDALYAAALRLTRNNDDSRDLVQETMLRALRFFHLFVPGTNCRAWLIKILHNNFNNRCRRHGREKLSASAEEFELEIAGESLHREVWEGNPERVLCARSVGGAIGAALEALPEDFRVTMMLVEVQELNYDEAASALGVPVGTIKSRMSRGRAMLRHALGRFARSQGVSVKRPRLRFTIRPGVPARTSRK
jgi:RNA polymerase sigma-70 factor (ECF subfamily)